VDNLSLTVMDIYIKIYYIALIFFLDFVNGGQILTLEDVAKVMKVSLKTVYRWVSSKKLRAAKIGHKTYRVLEGDLIQFVNDHIR